MPQASSVLAGSHPTAPASAPAGLPVVLVAGNPNSGKSTLFNALTGANTKVGNYPGVTVARASGRLDVPGTGPVELVDLPGSYSLSARSRDEQVAVDAVLGRGSAPPAAVVIAADATSLARTLYFTSEIAETGLPVVVALSMSDEAEVQGIAVDAARLSAALGADVVPVIAPRRQGLDALIAAIGRAVRGERTTPPAPHSLDPETEAAIEAVSDAVADHLPDRADHRRAWALWLLLSLDDDGGDDLAGIPAQVRQAVHSARRAAHAAGRDLDQEIIAGRYRRVDAIVADAVRLPAAPARSWTERIDGVLTHRVWGLAVFVAVMLALFQALFAWSEPAIAFIEHRVADLQSVTVAAMPEGALRDLLVDGVIAGVGNVIVFVPQIALLFLFIGAMEDAGYLSRVAFVIDRLMGRVGLHGKSFVPMLSGFSCAVPAVMATRTLEHRTDRLLTMAVLPLMSCSARLPIYVLVIATVFSPSWRVLGVLSAGALALLAMYALSVVAALAAAAVLRRTVLRGPRPTLVLELPPYRRPVPRVLLLGTWRQVRSFLVDAGTTILALTIVLWALLSYPVNSARMDAFDAERAAIAAGEADAATRNARLAAVDGRARGERLRDSVAGRLGRLLEPALEPLGFDWRMGVGILGAFAAREVFVSTMGIVFDIDDADEENPSLRDALRSARRADGSPLMTPLTGVSLMVFFVLACQCMSTLAVVRRESGSWSWPLFILAYQTALAYTASLVVYQTGRALGWG